MRTLVDTSVWIDHFRRGNSQLIDLLERDEVLIHPLVIGEVACGNLKKRDVVLESLSRLPQIPVASLEECLSVTARYKLHGKGLGIVDIHLLASSLLGGAGLFTLDKRLHVAADSLL